jgi:hypothetical protein
MYMCDYIIILECKYNCSFINKFSYFINLYLINLVINFYIIFTLLVVIEKKNRSNLVNLKKCLAILIEENNVLEILTERKQQ